MEEEGTRPLPRAEGWLEDVKTRPFITTFGGKRVNPIDIEDRHINIEDIAHALACTNRFVGHCPYPISVAQHSCYVSLVAAGGLSDMEVYKRVGLQGLLHDASEAYLGDVSKWVKGIPEMRGYRLIEEQVQRRIFRHFGLPGDLFPEVEQADRLMVRFEHEAAFGHPISNEPDAYGPLSDRERFCVGAWRPVTWDVAERSFLDLFKTLTR